MKLASAVRATLPLIAVTTRDVVNFHDILAHITATTPIAMFPGAKDFEVKQGKVYYWICPKGYPQRVNLEFIYDECTKKESTFIIVNVNQMEPIFFDCGEVDVPKDMLKTMLADFTDDSKGIMQALGGCTIKESIELARLTMAETAALTPDGVMSTRKTFFQPSRGLTQIDTAQEYYAPSQDLSDWLDDEGDYFLTGSDYRLRARGVLMGGWPGTGKTSGAKHIAHVLGVPLFRLDLSGVKAKYVGESEQNVLAALARLDNEEPCVALLDEIEKLFGKNESGETEGGTSASLLSQMLWYMQEHKSRVLLVLTSNDISILPKELHRPGRIDKRIHTSGLTKLDAEKFAARLFDTFPELPEAVTAQTIKAVVSQAYMIETIPGTKPVEVSHAVLTEEIKRHVKRAIKTGKTLTKMTGKATK